MQIRYKHQRFQTEAARSIANAFTGQPKSDGLSDHTIDQGKNKGLFTLAGFGNKNVVLAREAVCENVRAIQTEQGLKPVDYLQDLQGVGMAFTIEMETGTGKTYTYIKTMYELNERYGWTKFVVVVPSIAIREGVLKSFESMQEHFAQEYNGKRMQYFIYNSKQLSKIDALGSDFSFMGNQYRIVVAEKEYFIDLLFFNRRLQSLVAIELKRGEFKPEYAGKLNFYETTQREPIHWNHSLQSQKH